MRKHDVTGEDKGGRDPSPQCPGKKERKGVFLSDVQHVYLYSLLKFESFAQKNLVHKSVNCEAPNALKLTYEHL